MDQMTRKFLTKHKAIYLRDDVGRQYVSRKERGRRLTSIEGNMDAWIWVLKDNIKKKLRKTNYSNQKQHKQYKDQQNKNNLETGMGRKTTVWVFQVTN